MKKIEELSHTDTPKCHCLSCGYQFDATTILTNEEKLAPVAGDISVCLNCGEVMQFKEDLTVELLPLEKQFEYMADGDYGKKLMKAINYIKARGRFFK